MSIEAAPANARRIRSQPGHDSAQRVFNQDALAATAALPPELSAAAGIWPRQWLALMAAGISALALIAIDAADALLAVLVVPFAGIVVIRSLALWHALDPQPAAIAIDREGPTGTLPSYAILVPLYREQAVIARLVACLAALDYPQDKLTIFFITEHADAATREVLGRSGLSPNMSVLTVPEGQPRTKPRALNHALGLVQADYVVVYDAEDEPEPDQLRRAIAAFRTGGQRLGCLQAELKIYNAKQSWLTAQFAIEYAALFRIVLPALQRHDLPIPLGGTSNHFPRHVLQSVGAWDAFNVTEDADLGLRLARLGWQVGTLPSSTWEEAPPRLRDWLGQRRRWLKGWLQTAIVLSRQPRRLCRELGPIRFIATQLMLASMLLSAFVHPVYLVVLGCTLVLGDTSTASAMWWIGLAVFVAGYGVSIAVATLAAARSDHAGLLRHVVGMPIYWLLISVAAVGAMWEFAVRPFHWNKTPHHGRSDANRLKAASAENWR